MELVEKPSKIYSCRRCGCKLKIDMPEDIHYDIIKKKDRKSIYGYYIKCPICAKKIVVEVDKYFN